MRTVRTKNRFEYQLPETMEEFNQCGVSSEVVVDYAIRYIVATAQHISSKCADDDEEFSIDLKNVRVPQLSAQERAEKILRKTSPEVGVHLFKMLSTKH